MSKTQPYGADRCPNCGEYSSHYCGPSFGDEGFFICKKKDWKAKKKGGETNAKSNKGNATGANKLS